MGSNFRSPPSHAAFRILCPASCIGGIRNSRGVIEALRQHGAKIQIEEAPDECPDRVVTVMAPAEISTAIWISGNAPAELWGELGEETEVSTAQEAILSVFETILEVAAEADGPEADDGMASCRILVEKNQAESVLGKEGEVVAEIMKESGCNIRVLVDNLPACANPGEVMIEIEGGCLGVKMALISMAKRLQEWPPFDKMMMSSGNKNVESSEHQSLTFRADHSRRDPPLHAITSTSNRYTSGFDPLLYETEGRQLRQKVSFRILCSNDKCGAVVGRGGTTVRALEKQTGASISVGNSVAGSDETIITVSASENHERFSPAQEAAILVYSRILKLNGAKGQDSEPGKEKLVVARLLALSSQVGCLIGGGGSIVSEMQRVTGARITVLKDDSACAFENEEVVQVSGDFSCVQIALYAITGRLREKIFLRSRLNTRPYNLMKDPAPLGLDSLALPPWHMRHSAVTRRTHDRFGVMHNADDKVSRWLADSPGVSGSSHRAVNDVGKGLATFRSGPEFRSGTKLVVKNMTLEIAVPEELIHCVYGEIGQNLDCVRLISGAKVTLQEPLAGKSERTVVISGTPDEVQAAQSILHAFILTASYQSSSVAA